MDLTCSLDPSYYPPSVFLSMQRERNVFVLSVTTLLAIMGFFSWYYLFPLYLKELGASDTTVGALYTFFNLGFTLSQVMGGYLADRFGRKNVISIPTFLIALFLFLMPFFKTWFMVSLLCFLSLVASAIQWPAFTALLGESGREHGKTFGKFEFYLAIGIGIGPLLGSFLVTRMGIDGVIFLSALLTLIAALGRQIWLVETYVVEESSEPEIERERRGYLPFLLAGSLVFMALGLTVNGPFLSLFHGEVLGHPKAEINRLFAYGNLLGALFVLVAGRLADTIGAKRVMMMGIISHTVLVIVWALTGSSPIFVLSIPFVQWIYLSYQVVVLVRITRMEERGRRIGFFGTITGGLGSLSPVFGGYVKRGYGDLSPFWTALILGIASLMPTERVRE
jgi:MFS family permease